MTCSGTVLFIPYSFHRSAFGFLKLAFGEGAFVGFHLTLGDSHNHMDDECRKVMAAACLAEVVSEAKFESRGDGHYEGDVQYYLWGSWGKNQAAVRRDRGIQWGCLYYAAVY